MRGLVPFALRALSFVPGHLGWVLRPVVSTGVICVLQALLGTRAWVVTQMAIAVPAPGPLRVLRVVRMPLLGCWAYGLGARIFAHAHWRSLQFWKRVIPIYVGYKRTQVLARAAPRKARERLWESRHAWGAEKVRDGQPSCIFTRIVLTRKTHDSLAPHRFVRCTLFAYNCVVSISKTVRPCGHVSERVL